MRDATIDVFLNRLAAKQPTPGGGCASALGGAIGAALASMSAVYTSGEKYAAVEAQARALDESFTVLRRRFAELAEADIAAYGAYAAARGLPKATPEEKQARSAALREASEASTRVPEKIVAAALEGFNLLEDLARVANPNLAGDVAVAAYFLEASARGAGIQVLSNCAADDKEGRNAPRRAAVAEQIARAEDGRKRVDAAVQALMKR